MNWQVQRHDEFDEGPDAVLGSGGSDGTSRPDALAAAATGISTEELLAAARKGRRPRGHGARSMEAEEAEEAEWGREGRWSRTVYSLGVRPNSI